MIYIRFKIDKYKAIKDSAICIIDDPVPIIGINESGKSSALEALAHFDYRNDITADKRKWKFENRYIPTETEFIVSSEIKYDRAELQQFIDTLTDEEKSQVEAILNSDTLDFERIFMKNSNPVLRSYRINGLEGDLSERFCRYLILKLPKIFYFDNFLENQFPNKIKFPDEFFNDANYKLDEHQTIIDGMFRNAEYDLKSFLNETDENTKDTIISEVNTKTTEKLIGDWKKMNFDMEDPELGSVANIAIDVQQNRQETHSLDINIIEEFKDQGNRLRKTSMPLEERSLGFRWFFNFVAKKCFGARGEEKFIYLFDEPGSYLHNGAQKVLLKAIRDLAKDHPIIYTTHSEFLLDPEVININNIKVAEKKDREIKLIPLAQTKDKKNEGALTTLYNALRMKIPISSTLSQKVVVTEGITDYYFWKMLLNKTVFLPGFGAGSNEYLISIAIGTAKKYLAFFDGDTAGNEAIEKYKRFFGVEESINWKKYEKSNSQPSKLEGLFSDADKQRLLTITNASDPKKAITSLFFSTNHDTFWNTIDEESRQNIKKNIVKIIRILKINPKSINYGLGC